MCCVVFFGRGGWGCPLEAADVAPVRIVQRRQSDARDRQYLLGGMEDAARAGIDVAIAVPAATGYGQKRRDIPALLTVSY